jgi:hypothetical protein
MKSKKTVFIILIIVYFIILSIIFIRFFAGRIFEGIGNNSIRVVPASDYSPYSEVQMKGFGSDINPLGYNVYNVVTDANLGSYESLSLNLSNDNYPLDRDKLISYYIMRGWSYNVENDSVTFEDGKVSVIYSFYSNRIFVQLIISTNGINKSKLNSILTFSPISIGPSGGTPFSLSDMENALNSLSVSGVNAITPTSFTFYSSKLNKISSFTDNTPIEVLKGVGIIDSSSESNITNILNSYISTFNSWGYFPFTVYGAIIDNNAIYYLKYGLGGITIEVSVSLKNNYSIVNYTLEVSASASSNYISQFSSQGWKATFN